MVQNMWEDVKDTQGENIKWIIFFLCLWWYSRMVMSNSFGPVGQMRHMRLIQCRCHMQCIPWMSPVCCLQHSSAPAPHTACNMCWPWTYTWFMGWAWGMCVHNLWASLGPVLHVAPAVGWLCVLDLTHRAWTRLASNPAFRASPV